LLNKTQTNLLIDFTIFIVFLLAGEPAITGLPIHEWLSLAFIAALITHLLLHWDWIVSVTARFFHILFHESRFNYLVDFLVFLSFITVMLSGLLVSQTIARTLGIQFQVSRAWREIHSLSADATLLLIGLHFAMHWKWIVNTIQRYIFKPLGRGSAQPVKLNTDK
jgi:cytochrome b